jgi:polyphosphate kinase
MNPPIWSSSEAPERTAVPEAADPPLTESGQLFLDRELGWLAFNFRVLHEAQDERTPLLERVRFLSIASSILDEFYMKRVGGLRRQIEAGVLRPESEGEPLAAKLAVIQERIRVLESTQGDCFSNAVQPALEAEGIELVQWRQLAEHERELLNRRFDEDISALLTPLSVDPGRPFPFLSNLSTSLGICIEPGDGEERIFARVKIPKPVLPPILRIDSSESAGGCRFISLQDVILHNLDRLFPETTIASTAPFRITRNAAVENDDDEAEDLLDQVTRELHDRRFADVIRLEHTPDPDPWIRRYLSSELELDEADIYDAHGMLDFTDLDPIADLPISRLRYPQWTPAIPPEFADEDVSIFNVIRNGDRLVHHPYESFAATVHRFISTAADDPNVLAVKMTLYRTDEDSPFIETLIRAAEKGKQVACLVELKARFDEYRNIRTAQTLERAGVHVIYGMVGLKTHCKTALIVRREGNGMRAYAHVGTGNYHTVTANLYTDVGLLTCDGSITRDIIELFHYLTTGRAGARKYERLLIAPINMRARFLEMIQREAAHCRAGRPAGIVAKMNALQDHEICTALYEASHAGVPIDLVVRGICCLRPGVESLSENIRVVSVIGRFLEHSRIFHFRNGQGDPLNGEYYIGSADWMHRNLDHRIEAITPIKQGPLRRRLWEILQTMLNDRRQAWDMRPDGTYVQRAPATADESVGAHDRLMKIHSSAHAAGELILRSPSTTRDDADP